MISVSSASARDEQVVLPMNMKDNARAWQASLIDHEWAQPLLGPVFDTHSARQSECSTCEGETAPVFEGIQLRARKACGNLERAKWQPGPT